MALNPAHTKPVASGAPSFIVPVDKADTFRENLEAYDKPLVSWTTYSAHKGESFDAIARKHHLTAPQLKAANSDAKLDKRGRLKVATMVMVPMAGKGPQPVKVASIATQPLAEPVAMPASETIRIYTVRQGDTLYGIAQKYRTRVETLLEMNRLTAGATLHPGLKLKVP